MKPLATFHFAREQVIKPIFTPSSTAYPHYRMMTSAGNDRIIWHDRKGPLQYLWEYGPVDEGQDHQ